MTQRTAGTVRLVATAAAAVLTATLVAGCDVLNDPSSTPSPSPSPDPKSELLKAVPDEQDPAFKFTGSDASGDVSGVIDPANKGIDINTVVKEKEFTLKMSFRAVESQLWMKVNFQGAEELHTLMKLPKKWMELDRSKLDDPDDTLEYEGADPGNTEVIIRAATEVQAQDGGTYTGFVDLTANPSLTEVLEPVDVTALGDDAKQVPFTAVVGDDGNLASLTLNIPPAGEQEASEYVVKYFDFGTAPAVTALTADQAQKATTSAYDLLNG